MTDVMRSTYRPLSDAELALLAALKRKAQEFHDTLDGLQGREISLAKTKIEEAVMWAVKGITG